MYQVGGKTQEDEAIAFLDKVMAAYMETPAFRRVSASIMADMAAAWAGSSRVKQAIAGKIVKAASDVIDPTSQPEVPLADAALWSAPGTVSAILFTLPQLINMNLAILVKLEKSWEQLPPAAQADYLCRTVAQIDAQQIGRLLTTMVKSMTAIYRSNPTFLSDVLEGPMNEFMKHTDFGELKEMVDAAGDSLVAAAGMLSRLLWEYPGKMACLQAINMTLINLSVRSLNELMKPLDNAAPESLADLLFAFFRTIEGKQIASLINAFTELIRKLHTGSILLGEGGRPLFELDLANKLREAFPAIDPVILRKAKVALAEDRESIAAAQAEAHLDHPALYLEVLSHWAAIKNPDIRGLRKKISILEELPEDDMTEAISRGVTDLDAQEIGEIINALLRVLNRVHASKPETGFNLLASLGTALDGDELKAASEWMIRDAVTALKPAAAAMMPSLLRGFHELLTPQPGEDSRNLEEALAQLGERLCQAGGRK